MNFLLWFFGIWLGITLVIRLFGRHILRFGVSKLMRRLQAEAEARQRAYEQHFEAGDMQEQVYAEEEVKVTSPKYRSKPEVQIEEIAEDVEFEELN